MDKNLIMVLVELQLAIIPSCLLLLMIILWIGPLLRALPMVRLYPLLWYSPVVFDVKYYPGQRSKKFFQCTLAVIILMALRSMFRKFSELPKLWPISKVDFVSFFLTGQIISNGSNGDSNSNENSQNISAFHVYFLLSAFWLF